MPTVEPQAPATLVRCVDCGGVHRYSSRLEDRRVEVRCGCPWPMGRMPWSFDQEVLAAAFVKGAPWMRAVHDAALRLAATLEALRGPGTEAHVNLETLNLETLREFETN